MNTRKLAIVGVSLAAAFLVAVMTSFVFNSSSQQVVERIVERIEDVPTVEVLIVNADVDPGERLSAGQLEWRVWPSQLISPKLITKTSSPDAVKRYEGALARERMFGGEPFDSRKVITGRHGGGYMSLLLEPGKRAVSLPVDMSRGVAGFALPGDRVDILMTAQMSERSGRRVFTRTLLEGVRILAIDQATSSKKGSLVGKVVTLEVTPAQARSLVRAGREGDLSLALRSVSDDAKEPIGGSEEGGSTVLFVQAGVGKMLMLGEYR